MKANWIFNSNQTIYHLQLRPENLASTIITVGDPERVQHITKYFDSIEFKQSSREFVTHTGFLKNKRITVISTGIGTDNIDIVLNEIDALFNINFDTNQPKEIFTKLNFIRIGTSGALQKNIDVDSLLISQSAIGIDALMNFYSKPLTKIESAISIEFEKQKLCLGQIYYAEADTHLVDHFKHRELLLGTTLTAPGFYAPQGRKVRIEVKDPELLCKISATRLPFGDTISNMEMETSGIYGLALLMGHRAISLNAILANRITNEFSSNPEATMDKLIQYSLEKIVCIDD